MEENDGIMIESTLEALRPRRYEKIMDLVAEAGIDVTPWGVRKDGSVVNNPRTNQIYCYEWAFGGGGQPTTLCVWHKSLVFSQGLIFYEGSMRQYAQELDRVATDRFALSDVRRSARTKAKRAQKFDLLLQYAYRKSEPLRVVILQGKLRSQPDSDWDTSKVQYRALDSEFWYVHSYLDSDGSCRLVRKVPPDGISTENDTQPPQPVFVDQFYLLDRPGKHESAGFDLTDLHKSVKRFWNERREYANVAPLPDSKWIMGTSSWRLIT
jgi:hypothetical protein